MSAEQNKSIVRRWVEEGWNKRNTALIDELYTPNFYQHETGPETVTSREALKPFVAGYLSAIPDMVLILIYQLWRTQKTSLRLSAYLMLVAVIVYEVFLVIRTISIAANPPQNASSLTPVQSATYLFAFAISIFWSTGFILMVVSSQIKNR